MESSVLLSPGPEKGWLRHPVGLRLRHTPPGSAESLSESHRAQAEPVGDTRAGVVPGTAGKSSVTPRTCSTLTISACYRGLFPPARCCAERNAHALGGCMDTWSLTQPAPPAQLLLEACGEWGPEHSFVPSWASTPVTRASSSQHPLKQSGIKIKSRLLRLHFF